MIKAMTSKNKIVVLVVAFVIFAIVMFWFGYGVMDKKNQLIADAIAERNVELEVLQREQKSFEQGKKDLAILEKSEYPPEELFSRDTKVVKEIQLLEAAAAQHSLELKIAVSGSVKAAKPVTGTNSGLYSIPYTLTLEGSPDKFLQFSQALERMPFITRANNFTLNVTGAEKVTALITSEFYIKK